MSDSKSVNRFIAKAAQKREARLLACDAEACNRFMAKSSDPSVYAVPIQSNSTTTSYQKRTAGLDEPCDFSHSGGVLDQARAVVNALKTWETDLRVQIAGWNALYSIATGKSVTAKDVSTLADMLVGTNILAKGVSSTVCIDCLRAGCEALSDVASQDPSMSFLELAHKATSVIAARH